MTSTVDRDPEGHQNTISLLIKLLVSSKTQDAIFGSTLHDL